MAEILGLFPPAGVFLYAGQNAPAQIQDRLFLTFFSGVDAGIMAWDISVADQDILFPVLIRKFRMDALAQKLAAPCRELLNGGPSTLKAGTERDFFMLYDARPHDDITTTIDDQLSYTVLTHNAVRIQALEDMRVERFLVLRGYIGIDAAPLRQQISDGWWRWSPADKQVIFDLAADRRFSAVCPTRVVN